MYQSGLLQLSMTIALLLTIFCDVRADIIDIQILTDKASYLTNETVHWRVVLNLRDQSASNFGIASIAINLQDSRGDQLSTGVVNTAPAPLGFGGYSFRSGGTWNAASGSLLEVGAVMFVQNSESVVGRTGINPTNGIQLASGSYSPTTLGIHELTGALGSSNTYFTGPNQFLGAGDITFSQLNFEFASFTVSAVPEPSSLVLCSLGGIYLESRRRRYRMGRPRRCGRST